MKTYSQLIALPTFQERFDFLKLDGEVGADTFGWDRYLNQSFYKSKRWKDLRRAVILRDNGCDLGHPDHPINGPVYIHHINPIDVDDLINQTDKLTNPEYLICVSKTTHSAIHYGDKNKLVDEKPVVRSANDTCPWKK